jgi:FkbM family methyltransferase
MFRGIPGGTAPLRCTIATNRHGVYCVPASALQRPAGRLVVAGEVYEPATIELVAAHCGTGDIVHAGTYFGDLLPAFSRCLAPEAKVWAFEPNPESYRCARVTLELNGLTNVALAHAGLGAVVGRGAIQTTDGSGRPLGGCSQVVAAGVAAGCQPVEIVTVDATISPDRNVSVIQLDVEGHEVPALTGALATIRRCRPLLVLEVQAGSRSLDGAWFRDEILGLGYRRIGMAHGNVVFQCP